MAKKKVKQKEENETYTCACGSSSFINEGMANYREEVSISKGRSGLVLSGGSPDLDIISSTLKCAQCGAEVE
ncbi:hypothetical protein A2625_03990 [candidate division WOR-1 bacterium RIFCSPHIGHO2_01_FULL_53_15]|uniref:Uncharacterized protein n=1 Tax=candidate division WOR-1 bacterium RIFCSPHIGHO2_01_FULL_53_15 TaxID=1802564 RepID=A0A1F4Q0A0_UNCSA|nr:MAG: hypothetical protein A2625_03990 [candidate division WOR-1 bacterium RIFCSPHIGHO2_01_FULL_53_15]OGC12931.1 MAG: hypothetical protein A3D23_05025 [candidate division WOR-1 bacterium RIFCSPHIGHO2_02_FULL_53_26]